MVIMMIYFTKYKERSNKIQDEWILYQKTYNTVFIYGIVCKVSVYNIIAMLNVKNVHNYLFCFKCWKVF